jgi:c(7)-type cytochrome triheme protein
MNKVALIVSLLFIVFSTKSALFAVPADKTITWEGSGQGRVIFEGDEHAEKILKCDACHPSLFQMKNGSTKITLSDHVNGKYCGACHNGKTAFATDNPQKCNECHKKGEQRHRNRAKDKHHD